MVTARPESRSQKLRILTLHKLLKVIQPMRVNAESRCRPADIPPHYWGDLPQATSTADHLNDAVQVFACGYDPGAGRGDALSVIVGRLNATVQRISAIAQTLRDKIDGWQDQALLAGHDGARPETTLADAADLLDQFVARLGEALPYGSEFAERIRSVRVLANLELSPV